MSTPDRSIDRRRLLRGAIELGTSAGTGAMLTACSTATSETSAASFGRTRHRSGMPHPRTRPRRRLASGERPGSCWRTSRVRGELLLRRPATTSEASDVPLAKASRVLRSKSESGRIHAWILALAVALSPCRSVCLGVARCHENR
jgi:hypothetical protein